MPKNKKLVVNVGRGIANKNYMQEENWKGEGVKNWEICKRNLCMSPYQGIYRFAVVPFLWKSKTFWIFYFDFFYFEAIWLTEGLQICDIIKDFLDGKWKDLDTHATNIGGGHLADQRGKLVSILVNFLHS